MHKKSVGREKEKTQRGTYKLTLFHLSWVWVECLVGNASFKERPFRMVKNKICLSIETCPNLVIGVLESLDKEK